MARFKDRETAIKLRKAGKSYREIRTLVKVSKSSLSLWLRDVPLTQEQVERISTDRKFRQVETYMRTVKARQERIRQEHFQNEKQSLGNISPRDFYMAGLFLYLGEGTKIGSSAVTVSNSDPAVIQFVVFWFTKILRIDKQKIAVRLHLYNNMDVDHEIHFWSTMTGIPPKQFGKPYIKKTSSERITFASFGHGTCNVVYGNVKLKHRIMAGIKVLLHAAGCAPVAQLVRARHL